MRSIENRSLLLFLEQSRDTSLVVHVDLFSGGNLGKSGHGHDVTRENNHKSRACGDLDVLDGNGEAFGRAQESGIIRETILRLCNTYGVLAKAK